jgi:glutamate dehydrogenase (NADP+)
MGFVHDPEGIDEEKLQWVKEHKTRNRGRISDYAKTFRGSKFYEGQRPWAVPCELAFPCATQNELNGEDARRLVENGCVAVSEGANMPTRLDGVRFFRNAQVLYAPGKAANAGGVALSGFEMSQNSARLSWSETQLQDHLKDVMRGIHDRCLEHGGVAGTDYIDYVRGSNIAGFVKVAKAMLAYGVV